MSGPDPKKDWIRMLDVIVTAPASIALQPDFSVMCCAGIGTGAGPGTLRAAKHAVRLI